MTESIRHFGCFIFIWTAILTVIGGSEEDQFEQKLANLTEFNEGLLTSGMLAPTLEAMLLGYLQNNHNISTEDRWNPEEDPLIKGRPYLAGLPGFLVDAVFNRPMLFGKPHTNTNFGSQGAPMPPTSSKYCRCGTLWSGRSKNETTKQDIPDSGFSQFPWRIFFESVSNPGVRSSCTGTLIHDRWILTAASCLLQFAPVVTIFTGDSPQVRIRSGSKNWIFHPEFNPLTRDHDIALIRLSRPPPVSANILPICLPWKIRNLDFSRAWVTVSGWEDIRGETSWQNLEVLRFPFYTSHECATDLKLSKINVTITDNMVCTYGEDSRVCKVNGGGSLDYYHERTKSFYMIGIPLSMNYSCDSHLYHPQIATKITHLLTWILESTGYAGFCVP